MFAKSYIKTPSKIFANTPFYSVVWVYELLKYSFKSKSQYSTAQCTVQHNYTWKLQYTVHSTAQCSSQTIIPGKSWQYNAPVHNYIYVPGKSISMNWQYNAPVHNYIYVPGKSISMNWQYNAPVHNSSILRQSVSRESFTHAEKSSQITKKRITKKRFIIT